MATMTAPKQKPPAADRRPWVELPPPPEIPDLGEMDAGYATAKATLDRLVADEAHASGLVDELEDRLEHPSSSVFEDAVNALLRGEEVPASAEAGLREELREARRKRDILRVAIDRAKGQLAPHEARCRVRVAESLRPYREFLALAALHAVERLAAIEQAQDRVAGDLRRAGLLPEMFQPILPHWFGSRALREYAEWLLLAGAITPGVAAGYGVEGRPVMGNGDEKR